MRLAIRSIACAAIFSLGLIACGGDDGGDDDSGGSIDPTGTNHTFAVSAIDLPTNGTEAMALGLDIDGKANDGVDNQLGSVLGSIGALAPSLNLQATLDTQIDKGQLVLLVNVKAKDLTNASGVGMWVYLGTHETTPPACTDANDTVCRHQFSGTGMFTVDTTGPTDSKLAGRIMAGKFTGGPGEVTLQIALAGTPISLPLKKARAEITGITASGWATMSSKIGGAVTQADINATVMPAIGNTVRTSFDTDCDVGGTPPGCGCTANSTGATLKNLFDKAPTQDCTISDAEVMTVVSGFLTPDIDLDGDGTNDALSLGLGVTGVAGTFTVP
jgi:hypothetical protein